MTTFDFWVTDLDAPRGGAALSRSGRDAHAHYLGWTLWEFLGTGRAPRDPKHCNVADIKTVVSGEVLAEIFRETERTQECVLRLPDGRSSVDVIDPAHRYEITFLEF